MRYGHYGHGPYLSVSQVSKCPYLGHSILGHFSDNYVSSDVIKQKHITLDTVRLMSHEAYCIQGEAVERNDRRALYRAASVKDQAVQHEKIYIQP